MPRWHAGIALRGELSINIKFGVIVWDASGTFRHITGYSCLWWGECWTCAWHTLRAVCVLCLRSQC